MGRKGLPLRSPHAPEKNRLGRTTQSDCLLRQGLAFRINRRSPHQSLFPFELKSMGLFHRRANLTGRRHHFGANSVPRQDRHESFGYCHLPLLNRPPS